jgi:hypothetical protein
MAVVKEIDMFSWQNNMYPETHLYMFSCSFSERELGEQKILLTKCSGKLGLCIQVGKYYKAS